MWGMIVSLVQGIVTGVVGPAFTYLGKRQDVGLQGFQTGTQADIEQNAKWLDYQIQIQTLKLQSSNWWGPRLLYMIAGGTASLHFAAVMLDSIPFFWHPVGSWGVAALPGDYRTYEAWVIGSLFVTSIAKGPLSAAQAWMQRK